MKPEAVLSLCCISGRHVVCRGSSTLRDSLYRCIMAMGEAGAGCTSRHLLLKKTLPVYSAFTFTTSLTVEAITKNMHVQIAA